MVEGVGVMERLLRKLSGSAAGTTALSLLFFIFYYVYLWLVVDLRLIYHGGGIISSFPVFFREWSFFQGYLCYAGGPVDYVSAFLSQFFCIGWAGALVATLQAWLLWLCAGSIMRAAVGWRPLWICALMPVCLLALYTLCSFPFAIAMTLLAAFGFVCLYMQTAMKNRVLSILFFIVLAIVVYVAAGKAYLLFAVLCAMYEFIVRRRWLNGVVCLAAASVISYLGNILIFDTSIVESLSRFRPFPVDISHGMLIMIYIFYMFLPVSIAVLWLLRLIGISPSGRISFMVRGTVPSAIGLLLPFVIGIAVAYMLYDSRFKAMLEIDYYGGQKMWPEVLRAANYNPGQKLASKTVNRALYHTGRLTEDMFCYSQNVEALFMSRRVDAPAFWELYDTFIDLGQMNMAEYALLTCIETYGERPILLRRLALVNMVKGNIDAAKVFLGALGKTMFDADWAGDCLKKIECDPNLSADKEVQYLRSVMVEKDRPLTIEPNMLQDLLDKNRHNRMAYEYLMGYYLLNRQFDDFVRNMDRLDDFGYTRIPRVFEEAILFYNSTKQTQLELHGREISAESRQRFADFMGALFGRYKGNRNEAYDELANNYGDSYIFYCVYGQSGIKK
jgi:hypothetical protein